MYMPFDDAPIEVSDINEFIRKVKEEFNKTIAIYARSVKNYSLPVCADNLKFEFVARNHDITKYSLSDDDFSN